MPMVDIKTFIDKNEDKVLQWLMIEYANIGNVDLSQNNNIDGKTNLQMFFNGFEVANISDLDNALTKLVEEQIDVEVRNQIDKRYLNLGLTSTEMFDKLVNDKAQELANQKFKCLVNKLHDVIFEEENK